MMLSDGDLQDALNSGSLAVIPPGVMQPASIDLTLGLGFQTFQIKPAGLGIDPDEGYLPLPVSSRPGDTIWFEPGQFALGCTAEKVWIGDGLAARIEGKSSLGRLGLMVHSTAGFVDPGFHGQLTLELHNVNRYPIALRPGMAIAQLCVFELKTPARRPYGSDGLGSRYQDQQGPTASRSWMGPGGSSRG
jgi:dCTP deaminase